MIWIIVVDLFLFFVLFCFSLSKPPLYQRDLFPTQYLLVWIIVVDPFLQQCHFFVCLFVCFLFFSFGASFVPKKLVSNLICISMNYCCESLSPTMSVLFCFVFLFWSLLCEKEIGFQLNIYWYELLLWIPFSNNFFFLFLFLSFCLLFFSFGAFFVPKKLVSNSICISMNYCCGPLSLIMSFLL